MKEEDVCMVQRSHAFTIIVGTIIFEVNKISQISQTKVCNLVPVNYMSITTSIQNVVLKEFKTSECFCVF